MTVRTQAVLDQVNATTGSDWHLGEPMTGGWQAGAWRLHDGEVEAVLKWWDRPSWAPRVMGAASLIDAARRQGYPTPAWLAHGTTVEGYPFQVQDFVVGKPVETLTTAAAQLLIDLIDQQRGIALRTEVNWASFMRTAAMDYEGEHQQRLQGHGGLLLDVLTAARQLAVPHANCVLPETEMVHRDLSMSNVLVRGGVVTGAVDIEAIGRGCAVFDLLTPVRQGHMHGADADVLELLVATALSLYGAGPVALATAAHAIDILSFGLDHWPHRIDDAAIACLRWVRETGQRLV